MHPLQTVLYKGYPDYFSPGAGRKSYSKMPRQLILDALKELGNATCRQIAEHLDGELSSNHVNGYMKLFASEGKIKQHSVVKREKGGKGSVSWMLA